jgi:hypothetical protein
MKPAPLARYRTMPDTITAVWHSANCSEVFS